MSRTMRSILVIRSAYRHFQGMSACARRNIYSANTAILVGITTLCVQLLLLYHTNNHSPHSDTVEELGDEMYYGRHRLGIHYAEYAKMAAYKLVLKPNSSTDTVSCDDSAYELHKIGGLPIRNVGLYQSLGDTNVHHLGAYLDHREAEYPVIRVLAVGLHPGPGDQVYCNYQSERPGVEFCSSQVHGVILLAGNYSDYPPGKNSAINLNRKSPCFQIEHVGVSILYDL